MPEELKVTKFGNSAKVVISKRSLAALRIEVGDTLYAARISDGSIRLTAENSEFDAQMKVARKGMRRYTNALRELAR